MKSFSVILIHLGVKVIVLFKGEYLITVQCTFYVVQLQVIHLLDLQCNVLLAYGSSVTAEPLVTICYRVDYDILICQLNLKVEPNCLI